LPIQRKEKIVCKAKQGFPLEEVLIGIDDLYVNFKTESIVIEGEIKTSKKRNIRELGQKFAIEQ